MNVVTVGCSEEIKDKLAEETRNKPAAAAADDGSGGDDDDSPSSSCCPPPYISLPDVAARRNGKILDTLKSAALHESGGGGRDTAAARRRVLYYPGMGLDVHLPFCILDVETVLAVDTCADGCITGWWPFRAAPPNHEGPATSDDDDERRGYAWYLAAKLAHALAANNVHKAHDEIELDIQNVAASSAGADGRASSSITTRIEMRFGQRRIIYYPRQDYQVWLPPEFTTLPIDSVTWAGAPTLCRDRLQDILALPHLPRDLLVIANSSCKEEEMEDWKYVLMHFDRVGEGDVWHVPSARRDIEFWCNQLQRNQQVVLAKSLAEYCTRVDHSVLILRRRKEHCARL